MSQKKKLRRRECIRVLRASALSDVQPLGSESADLWCLRGKSEGIVQVNTALLSYPSAISCHNQLGANQQTPVLPAAGKSSQDSCLYCSNKINSILCALLKRLLSKRMLWFLVFSSRKQALCVYSRPLQQPRLLDIASLQPELSSGWWWSYRVISPTQRLLRWEMWEVCGCQSMACRDDSVRHLE